MAKIQIMNNNLANKIAAGEVVERPASVVKELSENAIDAQATKIDIFLEDSGIKTIKIIDNGNGMDSEDAQLAFFRHATSKLLKEEDLFRINSLGFRGEALPSIASVSEVTLITSTGENGTKITLKGGKVVSNEGTICRKGTEITVSNLFYNTPARLKYLKGENTELSYCVDFITKIAISHPEIAFKLANNNRVLLQTFGNNNLIEVIHSIYGIDVAKNIKNVKHKDSLATIDLYFTTPEINRTTRSYINIVINNRIVRNNELVKAILEGYESYLPINRFPVVILDINVDPLLIDVNVHPAKHEVRIANLEHIKSVIVTLLRNKLKEYLYVPKVIINEEKQSDSVEDVKQEQFSFKESEIDIIDVKVDEKPLEKDVPFTIKEEKEPFKAENRKKLPKLYYIGQFMGTYLLAQNDEGLYLIDQHAANERVNYEYYLSHFSKDTSQYYELLVPLTFTFSLSESLLIEANLGIFTKMKITIEKFGLSGFIVSKIPLYLKRGNEEELLKDIFAYILKNKKITLESLFNEIAISLSCKRSIKANHFINELEVENLLIELQKCEQPYTCPHGRPVIITMTKEEIERLFKRTM